MLVRTVQLCLLECEYLKLVCVFVCLFARYRAEIHALDVEQARVRYKLVECVGSDAESDDDESYDSEEDPFDRGFLERVER